ncbi:MAG: PD-(D/E)XK nuclease family protein [Nitrospiraceae bacterium]|nr:PD-(D/E)XK nuclease family protein [Nitrospiraceae bacterium]
MLEIFPAPPGTRRVTTGLLEKALAQPEKQNTEKQDRNDFSGILYLAPAPEKRKEAQKTFHEILRLRGMSFSYIPPIMLTPGQLSRKLFREAGGLCPLIFPSWLKVPLLMRLSGKGAGHAANIAAFMAEMKDHFPGRKALEIQALLAPALSGLGIAEEVGERLGQTLEIIALYDEALEKNGFLDAAGTAGAACMAAALADGPDIHTLILDGFHELSPAEKLLAQALIEKAENTLAAVPQSKKYPEITEDYLTFLKGFPHREIHPDPENVADVKTPAALKYYACPSMEEEVETAARRIKVNYISGAFTDLSRAAVVVPSVSEYTDMIERVFVKYGVPCSFPSGSKNSMRARMEKDLLSVFDTPAGGYEARALASLLTSPFFADIPSELGKWAASITLSAVAGGFKNWLASEGAPGPGLGWLKKRFHGLEKSLRGGEGEGAGLLNGYLEALKGLGFSSSPATGSYGEELEDRLNGFSLLEQLAPDCAPKSRSDRNRAFREALAGIASGIEEEREEPGVRILGFREALGLEPESLYFLGLRDGEMPARQETDFFLPERLRAELGLNTMKKNLLIEEFLFHGLTSGPAFVHLSCPQMEMDKVFLPSIFISEGEPLKDPAYGIFSKEEELVRKGRLPYSAHLKEIAAPYAVHIGKEAAASSRKKPRPRALNVTDVDSFRACPRFFYLERLMGLAPSEAAQYGLEPKTVGTLLHAAMEALMPLRREDDDLQNFRMRAGGAIEAVLAENPAMAGVPPYWGRLLKETFLGALPGIHEIEMKFRKEGFTRTAVLAEGTINGELKGARLKGKIDRIDENDAGGLRIIDYKTGPAALNPGDVLRKGTSLQLFLYAALAKTRGIKDIRSVGIYSLKDLKVKLVPNRSDAKAGRSLEDYVEAALGYLEETVRALDAGDFRAAPSSEQNCRRCHEKPYCPFIHGGAA